MENLTRDARPGKEKTHWLVTTHFLKQLGQVRVDLQIHSTLLPPTPIQDPLTLKTSPTLISNVETQFVRTVWGPFGSAVKSHLGRTQHEQTKRTNFATSETEIYKNCSLFLFTSCVQLTWNFFMSLHVCLYTG